MVSRSLSLIALLLPTFVLANPADQECQDWTRQAVESPTVGCEGACSQARRFDKYDYHAGLVASQKTRTGLERFLHYTGRSTIVGAGADEQACHLYSLLVQWGDAAFAETLLKAGPRAKERVIGLLDYAAVSGFKQRFPKTYGLVLQHEE
jgi:hypothetical protein